MNCANIEAFYWVRRCMAAWWGIVKNPSFLLNCSRFKAVYAARLLPPFAAMSQTDLTLAQQLRITPTDLQERMRAFDIEQKDLDLLASFQSVVAGELDTIAQEVFDHLGQFDDFQNTIGDRHSMNLVREAVKAYIMDLFGGYCDESYVNAKLRIGLAYQRMGVGPKLILAAVNSLTGVLERLCQQRGPALLGSEAAMSLQQSARKAIQFDVHLLFEGFSSGLESAVKRADLKVMDYTLRLEEEVKLRTQSLHRLTQHDSLTGLLNRKAFLDHLHHEIKRSKDQKSSLCLATLDLNQFKKINDQRGHLAGDEALAYVGKVLSENIRETDIAVRQGGDEFAIIFPNTEIEVAKEVCQRLHKVFGEAIGNPLTLSMGVAQCGPRSFATVQELIQKADELMYCAKRAGIPDGGIRAIYGCPNLRAI
ncbi:MAG: hypothetical protein COA70_11870 [Planctomycetota bacterium]|nr:MAG: hypothetical protein COA70_11870 [Planctomycetota bacterium]